MGRVVHAFSTRILGLQNHPIPRASVVDEERLSNLKAPRRPTGWRFADVEEHLQPSLRDEFRPVLYDVDTVVVEELLARG